MSFKTLLSITIFILAVFSVRVKGDQPLMKPNMWKRELEINEGEPLKISCNNTHQPLFIFPGQHEVKGIITSKKAPTNTEFRQNGVSSTFLREKTVLGDMGWYGCYDSNESEPTDPDHYDLHASWLYVYIKSKDHAFAPTASKEISGVVGGSVVIPCRPTSPDLHVKITKPGKETSFLFWSKDVQVEVKNAEFNPKKGFTLKELSDKDATSYTCSAVNENGHEETLTYTLKVEKNQNEGEINNHSKK